MTSEERKAVIDMVSAKKLSFQLVADALGYTRNQVAGVMFRHRYPYKMRVGPFKNKIGTGRHGPGTHAKYTARCFEIRT